jgi:hypothetical protein
VRRFVDERHEAEIEHAGFDFGGPSVFPCQGHADGWPANNSVVYPVVRLRWIHAIKLDADLANILLVLTPNAAKKICAAMDLFVVPTISFRLLWTHRSGS